MVQFPAVVMDEWVAVATAAEAEDKLRAQIEHDTLVERELERLRIKHEASVAFQQELDEEETPDLQMMTMAAFLAQPNSAPSDLIEGVMKERGVAVVLGPSRAGKSSMALQMIHSMMTGTDFLGQAVKTVAGSIGMLSYDMDASMLMNWLSGAPNIDANRVSVVNAHGRGNPVRVPSTRKQIADAWKAAGTEVVLLDSFSASFFGTNQNDTAETMAHYRDMTKFALTECGAKALIVIVHSTDTNPLKPRGSTAHIDTPDTILAVTVDDTGQRHVSVEKYREALGTTKMSPRVVTAPDAVTHLVDVDTGAMTLTGYPIPPSLAAAAFATPMPTPISAPDIESDDEEDDDL